MSTSGETNFNAYREARGGVNHDGTPTPKWDALTDEVREGWEHAAAKVARDHHNQQFHFLTKALHLFAASMRPPTPPPEDKNAKALDLRERLACMLLIETHKATLKGDLPGANDWGASASVHAVSCAENLVKALGYDLGEKEPGYFDSDEDCADSAQEEREIAVGSVVMKKRRMTVRAINEEGRTVTVNWFDDQDRVHTDRLISDDLTVVG